MPGLGLERVCYGKDVIVVGPTRPEKRLAACLLLVMLTLSCVAAAAEPAAEARWNETESRVLWLEGSVSVSAGAAVGSEPVVLKAQIADRLHPGEQITLDRGARLWLLAGRGELLTAEGPIRLVVSGEGVTPIPIGDAESTGSWRRLRVAGLPTVSDPPVGWEPGHRQAGLAAGEPGLRALEPVETSVRDDRPVLRWQLPEGRDRVDLTLWRLEADGSRTPVEVWRGLHGNELRPWKALERQRYYLWQARALAPPPSQSSEDSDDPSRADVNVAVWFRLLGDKDVSTVRRSMTALSKHQADHPHSAMALQVLRALLLERYGLLREAEETWRLIAARRLDREGLENRLARLRQRRLLAPQRIMGGGSDHPVSPSGSGGAAGAATTTEAQGTQRSTEGSNE